MGRVAASAVAFLDVASARCLHVCRDGLGPVPLRGRRPGRHRERDVGLRNRELADEAETERGYTRVFFVKSAQAIENRAISNLLLAKSAKECASD